VCVCLLGVCKSYAVITNYNKTGKNPKTNFTCTAKYLHTKFDMVYRYI